MKWGAAAVLFVPFSCLWASLLFAQPQRVPQGEAIKGWPATVATGQYAFASGADFASFMQTSTHPDPLKIAAMVDTGEVRQLATGTQVLILTQNTQVLTRIVVLDGPYAREFLWVSGGIQSYRAKWKPLTIRYKPNEWPGLYAMQRQVEGELLRQLENFIRVYDAGLKPKETNVDALGQEIRRKHPWVAHLPFFCVGERSHPRSGCGRD